MNHRESTSQTQAIALSTLLSYNLLGEQDEHLCCTRNLNMEGPICAYSVGIHTRLIGRQASRLQAQDYSEPHSSFERKSPVFRDHDGSDLRHGVRDPLTKITVLFW